MPHHRNVMGIINSVRTKKGKISFRKIIVRSFYISQGLFINYLYFICYKFQTKAIFIAECILAAQFHRKKFSTKNLYGSANSVRAIYQGMRWNYLHGTHYAYAYSLPGYYIYIICIYYTYSPKNQIMFIRNYQ